MNLTYHWQTAPFWPLRSLAFDLGAAINSDLCPCRNGKHLSFPIYRFGLKRSVGSPIGSSESGGLHSIHLKIVGLNDTCVNDFRCLSKEAELVLLFETWQSEKGFANQPAKFNLTIASPSHSLNFSYKNFKSDERSLSACGKHEIWERCIPCLSLLKVASGWSTPIHVRLKMSKFMRAKKCHSLGNEIKREEQSEAGPCEIAGFIFSHLIRKYM